MEDSSDQLALNWRKLDLLFDIAEGDVGDTQEGNDVFEGWV